MRHLWYLCCGLILAGCTGGTAVILQEDTQELVDQAQEATVAARTFYVQQAQARYDYIIDFIAKRA